MAKVAYGEGPGRWDMSSWEKFDITRFMVVRSTRL